jgi:hypothetical protein
MSNPNTEPGTTRVDDRAPKGTAGTKATAGTGIAVGVLGLLAGIAAISDWFPVLMGLTAVVLGLIALVTAAGAWKRAKSRAHGHTGAPGSNLATVGLVAGIIAAVLGVVGVFGTGEVTDPQEGLDQLEQEADELGDEAEDMGDEVGDG